MPLGTDDIIRSVMQQRIALVGYAWAVVGDPHIAEDVFQDVAMAVVRKADQIENQEHLTRWLRRAIRLRGLEVRRNRGRAARLLSPEVLEHLDDLAATRSADEVTDRSIALTHCVNKLGDSARELINMRYVQGMKAGDIARDSGRSVDAVYKAITRTHRALRQCVERILEHATPQPAPQPASARERHGL